MYRSSLLHRLQTRTAPWDVIVIGGGATGLGVAVDAASRGYDTVLLERHDFSKGTSSRSTKLVHGGVRYLRQGNISLVLEALHERGLLIQNAPHLVRNLAFVVPSYAWWNGPFYGVGLKVYDLLAGKLGLGPSKLLSREETLKRIPTLEPAELRGGVVYHDGQFDDSRLAINLAQTAMDHGATVLNYCKVTRLLKSGDMVDGVVAHDEETGDKFELRGRVVINAAGIFADAVLKMDDAGARDILSLSQGVHLVLDKEFLPGESAIMVPQTDDGRVLFAVPWHNRVVVGTTDTPVDEAILEPRPLEEEIDFILNHAARYLTKDPTRQDVCSAFAGIRPLVNLSHTKDTAEISRDHHVLVSAAGLVTVVGGKWTTFRKMAEDTVNQATLVAGLEHRECTTSSLRIHGWTNAVDESDPLCFYGADAPAIRGLIESDPELGEPLHPALPYTKAEVVWAVEQEMARTVEDVLARRTRALLLDARASIDMAPAVAALLAPRLYRDESWKHDQIAAYTRLAGGYILG